MQVGDNINTTPINIPIQLSSIGNYSVNELKEKLMEYAMKLVGTSSEHDSTAAKGSYKFEKLEGMLSPEQFVETYKSIINQDHLS